jgi:DNA-binding NarL/FixJ family response regulator
MGEALFVQVLSAGVLRAALEEVLRDQPGIRVVSANARVAIVNAGNDWQNRIRRPERADTQLDPQAVVLLTAGSQSDLVQAALLGVQVFVDPEDPRGELVEGIRRAALRQAYCSRTLHAAMVQGLRQSGPSRPGGVSELRTSPLTDREWEVARLAGARMSNQQIAAALSISVPTVKTHLGNARRKLGISRRSQLSTVDSWSDRPRDAPHGSSRGADQRPGK